MGRGGREAEKLGVWGGGQAAVEDCAGAEKVGVTLQCNAPAIQPNPAPQRRLLAHDY